MTTPVQILLLEDSEFDVELVAHELKKLGRPFRLDRIQSEAELRHELLFRPPDLILSDHGLPSFSGFKALEIVRQVQPALPFIFVSGSNDQQMVVDMFDSGATDYVFKKDIQDLGPAVRQALEPPKEAGSTTAETPRPKLKSAVPPLGHLLFCPKCRHTWDDAGELVQMAQYLSDNPETVVLSRACGECLQSA